MATLSALSVAVLTTSTATAAAGSPTVANFEIDANIHQDASGTGAASDWANDGTDASPSFSTASTAVIPWNPGTGGDARNSDGSCLKRAAAPETAVLVCDQVKSDPTTYPGGAKEPDPSGWAPLQSSQVTPKTDITNVYADGRFDGTSGTEPYVINGMERLPKAGDVHLDFEYNRYLTTGGVAPATSSTGTTPGRAAGDVLIAYDLGGSVSQNLGSLEIRVFVAKDGLGCNGSCAGYDYANPTCTVSGTNMPLTDSTCGITANMNSSSIAAGPWLSYDDHYKLIQSIAPFGFAEAATDLRTATGLSSICVNFLTVKSRASESVTSQLKDTTSPTSFPFCSGLHIKKFLDYNANGARDTALPTTGTPSYASATEPIVSGWTFTVYAHGASQIPANVKCSGSTSTPDTTDAQLTCASLPAGSYDIVESQQRVGSPSGNTVDYFNTVVYDGTTAHAATNTSLTPTYTVTLGTSDKTVTFGNACWVKTRLTVNSVPTSVSTSFYIWYAKVKSDGSLDTKVKLYQSDGNVTEVTPAAGATTSDRYADISDTFTDADSIAWGYGETVSSVDHEITVKDGTAGSRLSMAGHGDDCANSDSTSPSSAVITGTKFKDINGDGVQTADEQGLGGFQFKLTTDQQGQHPVGATVYSCAGTTGAHPCRTDTLGNQIDVDGTYRFTGVGYGTYYVHEVLASGSGWVQTGPLDPTTGLVTNAVPVTVFLDSTSVNADMAFQDSSNHPRAQFGNTPLQKIKIQYEPETSNTQATVSCVSGKTSSSAGTSVTLNNPDSTNTNIYETPDLQLKDTDVVCTIQMSDP